jgi:hypothetical protein
MTATIAIDNHEIQQWVVEKRSPGDVEGILRARGLDDSMVTACLKEFKRQLNAKRQFRGFLFTALGAFLGFVSCLLTVLNPVPELYNLILFGLTSVAILFIFIGLYFLFE